MKRLFLVLVGCIALGSTALAADVAIFKARGVNIQPGELDAISELFYQGYTVVSKQAILGPSKTQEALEQAGSFESAATLLGVSQFVELSVVRLEQKITILAILREAGGQEIYRTTMAAYSMDDMEQVLDRLVKAVFNRVKPEETRDMSNVTLKEAGEENRLFAEKIHGLKIGGIWAFSSDGQDTNPLVSAQYDLRMEAKSFFLEMGAGLGLMAGSGARSYGKLFLEIGGSYYFINSEISPYVGAGIIPCILIVGNQKEENTQNNEGAAVNLTPYLQVGVMFMRSSSTRIYVDLRISHDLFPYEADLFWNGRTPTIRPEGSFRLTELALLVGIGW